MSLIFCSFDLYFLGMGLGIWIIVGGSLNSCTVLFVFGVFFLWLHNQAFGFANESGRSRRPKPIEAGAVPLWSNVRLNWT
jgi:hypothetical protein